MGALPPRYAFILNPHADTKFTKCPRCEAKTNLRKLSLVIHVEGFGLVLLGKTCRLARRRKGVHVRLQVVLERGRHAAWLVSEDRTWKRTRWLTSKGSR